MTRMSVFNSPLLLGFDHFERVLDRVSKTQAEGYPPYNIEQIGENRLRITLAVAGFAEQDLSVATEDNQLVIRGKQQCDDGQKIYLHRGIASRQFQRSFVLAEGIEITGAHLDNGLLHIDLERPMPEPVVRHIKINCAPPASEPMVSEPRTIDLSPERRPR
ncbi:Hsp20 family protein [Insolitispirillum peregrinum]|uniref:Molecular chaperone IbpA, HSP20 family n=1 Tax=Insolitispirillum peregrinum TaxID=80876 RepID=A0A1N7JTI1_9PROT|nr:Hsp20 family protein [Insolitispirillum peregrinum]SIS52653.1 Molecular chaperone IbpA, HSP20 family [Insolitispirillum peregrinum]